MKKLLALVLALVMTLGLATVGSNAALDFADADKISEEKLEAVTVVDAIGVMKGDETGFRPGDMLTRAEGAAILARLYGTPAFAASLNGDGSKFSDVPANFWNGNGSGMIEYCAVNGLLAGVGNGKFDPNGKLTVVAFAKMMLNALGYSTELEGYYGADWSIKVMSRANSINLFKGLDEAKPSDQINREQAAQMIFTALKSAEVEYSNRGTNLSVNGAEISIGATDAKPVTNEERARQTIYDNRVNAQQNANGAFVQEFAEDHFPQLIRTDTADEFGRPATTWTYARQELGTWENYDLLYNEWTVSVTGGTVYDAIGARAYEYYPKDIVVDGVLMEDLWGNSYVNYDAASDKQDLQKIYRGSDKALAYTGRGVYTALYVKDGASDAESYARLVVINTYLAKAEADYNKNDKTLSLGVYENSGVNQNFRYASSSVVKEDISGYKVGDYVTVTMTKPGTADAVIRTVKAAECKADTYVSAYTSNAGKVSSITYNETTTRVAKKAYYNPEILDNYGLETLKGFTYDVYMDRYGNVLGIDYHTTDTNYVFVVGTQSASSYLSYTTYTGNVIWMDGTMETIKFKVNNTASAAATAALTNNGVNVIPGVLGNPAVNAWFKFSKDDAGNVTLTDIVPIAGANTKVRQYADNIVRGHNGASVADIGPVYTTLAAKTAAGAATVAYGKDETVYITVAVTGEAAIAAGTGVIKSVNGVSTGIKTTAINTVAVNTLPNFSAATVKEIENNWAAPNSWDNTFYLYKDNGYLIAAVVVGDNAGVAKNFVYIIDGPEQRQYAGRYLDAYYAIKDNELTTVYVDSQKSGTTSVVNKLGSMRLHAVVYDKDGVVIGLKNVDKWGNWTSDGLIERNQATLNTAANAQAGYTFTYVTRGATAAAQNANVKIEGNTMLVNPAAANQCYILLDSKDCKFFVYNPDTYDFDLFTNAQSAYAAATKKNGNQQCIIYSVTSIVNGTTGIAKTVIIDCDYTGGGAAGAVTGITVLGTTAGNYANALFYTADGHAISYTEAISALVSQMKKDGINDVEISTTAFGAPAVTFTWNGMKVTMPINTLVGYNVRQVYKWSVTGGASGYAETTDTLTGVNGVTGLNGADIVVITADGEVVYTGAINGYNTNNMPSADIVITKAANVEAALEAALNAEKAIIWSNTQNLNAFTVPAGTMLYLDGDLILNGNVTVKGTVYGEADINANANDIIVDGGIIDLSENTLYFDELITCNGAKVIAKDAQGNRIEVGCSIALDEMAVDTVVFTGDEKGSTLAVADKLNNAPDVTFGTTGDAQAILSLPANSSSELGTVTVVNGAAMIENADSINKVVGNDGTELDIRNNTGIVTNIDEVNVDGGFTLDASKKDTTVDAVTGNGDIKMDAAITTESGTTPAVDPAVKVDGETVVKVVIVGFKYNKSTTGVYVTKGDTMTITFDKAIDGKVTPSSTAIGDASIDGKTLTLTVNSDSLKNGKTIKITGITVKELAQGEVDKTGDFVLTFFENGDPDNNVYGDSYVDIG